MGSYIYKNKKGILYNEKRNERYSSVEKIYSYCKRGLCLLPNRNL